MFRNLTFALIFGLTGLAILLWLGFWQLARLEWKEARIVEIETMLADKAQALQLPVGFESDNYRSVSIRGRLKGREIHFLTSTKQQGPGYHVISRLDTNLGPILIDLGYIQQSDKTKNRSGGSVSVTGNLLWPNEVDPLFTPEPNLQENIWFARDLPAMAKHLETQPILIVARQITPGQNTTPVPVTAEITNDHLEYAITWFSLALVWLVMTVYLLWRIRRNTL